jgi:hypothetical protein
MPFANTRRGAPPAFPKKSTPSFTPRQMILQRDSYFRNSSIKQTLLHVKFPKHTIHLNSTFALWRNRLRASLSVAGEDDQRHARNRGERLWADFHLQINISLDLFWIVTIQINQFYSTWPLTIQKKLSEEFWHRNFYCKWKSSLKNIVAKMVEIGCFNKC